MSKSRVSRVFQLISAMRDAINNVRYDCKLSRIDHTSLSKHFRIVPMTILITISKAND